MIDGNERQYMGGRLSCFHFMAQMGVLVAILCLSYFCLKYFYPINFKASPVASFKRILWIYQQRYWALGLSGVIILYISWNIVRRYHDFNIPTKITMIPLLIFYIGLFWIGWNIYVAWGALHLPMNDGWALIKFVRNIDKEMMSRVVDISKAIQASKVPIYLVLYSYLFIFSLAILIGGRNQVNRYGIVTKPVKKYHIVFALFFLGMFSWSVYGIVTQFILEDPFKYLDMLLAR